MNSNDRGPNHDLRHFLGLAGQQLRHKMKLVAVDSTDSRTQQQISRMRLLEDLINEQVPKNENTRNSTGSTR